MCRGAGVTERAYISYSRRADCSFLSTLVDASARQDRPVVLASVAVSDDGSAEIQSPPEPASEGVDPDDWELIHDEKALEKFGSINGFMETLSEGTRLIVLLSPGYFESPYCLTELLAIYDKRATDLIPIVVFVDGAKPGDIQLDEILKYWRDWGSGDPDKQRFAKRVRSRLPAALAWLLGRRDVEKSAWDTFFPVFAAADANAARQVLACLGTAKKPRVGYVSSASKRAHVIADINRVTAKRNVANWFKQLASQIPDAAGADNSLGAKLVDFSTEDDLLDRFDQIKDWLDEIIAETESGLETAKLAGAVKEMLGWMLLMVVDDARVHQLTHELNRLDTEARLEIFEENDSSIQLLASALSNGLVLYRFMPDESLQLQGEGRIDLLDRGADRKQYEKWLAEEENWFTIKTRLFENRVGRQRTESALDGAIRVEARTRKGLHLVIGERLRQMAKTKGFLDSMAKKFPEIHQVICREKEDGADLVQSYLRDGFNIGTIDQSIRNIYQAIHELSP